MCRSQAPFRLRLFESESRHGTNFRAITSTGRNGPAHCLCDAQRGVSDVCLRESVAEKYCELPAIRGRDLMRGGRRWPLLRRRLGCPNNNLPPSASSSGTSAPAAAEETIDATMLANDGRRTKFPATLP